MRIAYVVGEDDRDLAQAHAHALEHRGHEVHLLDELQDGFDATVRSEELRDAFAIVDDEVYRTKTPAENEPMRVLLAGAYQADFSGIAEGYGAAAHARWFHQRFDLIRVSSWVPSKEEPLDDVQEFHTALAPWEMTRLLHTCDVYLGSRGAGSGFDLAAAQAMAAGIPAVLTAVPPYLGIDGSPDFALFAPAGNAVELGERLIEALSDFELRERLRARGRAVAAQWHAQAVAERLERYFVERRSVR